MTKFVKVMCSSDNGIISTEIIKADNLIKIVKSEGNTGSGIIFEWFCESRKTKEQWIYECHSEYVRDKIFSQYERLLTGTEIKSDACPLVPVKTPHGRLIDADAFVNTVVFHTNIPAETKEFIEDLIEIAPTVIEAEEG